MHSFHIELVFTCQQWPVMVSLYPKIGNSLVFLSYFLSQSESELGLFASRKFTLRSVL